MSEFTGGGDPARSLALLWRTAARPSRAGQTHNAASNPAHMFEFGLQLLLDGIESLVQSTAQRRELDPADIPAE